MSGRQRSGAKAREMTAYSKETGFVTTGFAAPIVLMFLFIVFVYGAMAVGLMGVSNTLIHEHNLQWFLARGDWGAFWGMCFMLAAWAVTVFVFAAVPYFVLRARGKRKTARLTGQVIIFLMFHVFAMPFILWPMIRNSSPRLRAKRVAKLRRLVRKQQAEKKAGAAQAAHSAA